MIRIYTDGSWYRHELDQLQRGEIVERNGKRYRACVDCGKIVRVDKKILGSLHICN